MRSCSSLSSPTAHIAFCTLDDVLRPQILIIAIYSLIFPGLESWSRGAAKQYRRDRPGDEVETDTSSLFEPTRFFRQHDGDAVTDRIGELGLARNQFVTLSVVFERPLRQRADENFQQFRIDAIRRPFGGRDGGHEASHLSCPATCFRTPMCRATVAHC